jgi:hypothetical protein
LKYTLGILEVGVGYELMRRPGGLFGGSSNRAFTAVEAYGGARGWYHSYDLTLAVAGGVNLALLGLESVTINGVNVAVARNTMSWVDPLVGLRLRHQFAPGRDFRLSGDVGGFGVGSSSSWKAQAAYTHDFRVGDATLTGMVGYRILSVKYGQGEGLLSGVVDMRLQGPFAGLGMRW